MGGMKERERKSGAGTGVVVLVVAILVLLPILYFLSSGPVLLLFMHAGWPRQTWEVIYSPAMEVALCVNLGNALAWYINVWV
jgi:hypothetical protein